MKIEIKNLPKSEVELTVEISADEFKAFIDGAVNELAKNLKIEGFRQGKVPSHIAEEKIEKADILVKAADMAIKENYRKAVSENNLEPISQPEIDILKIAQGSEFVFKAKTQVLPEAKLPDYKKIASSFKKQKVLVTNEELLESMEWIRKSRAKFSEVAGPAKNGDFVEIEYVLSVGGGGSSHAYKDAFILGEGKFMPGFEEGIVGMAAGQEKDIVATAPENYFQKELAGKKILIKTKVISLKKVELPEINDDFIKGLGKFQDVDALKRSLKEGLQIEKENNESQHLRNNILEKVAKETSCEVPEILVVREKDRMLANLKKEVSQNFKIGFEEYLRNINKTEKEVLEQFALEAEKRVNAFLVIREIAKKENVQVSDKEVEDEVNKALKHYSSINQVKKDIDPKELREYTKDALRQEKVFQLLEGLAEC